MKDIKPATPLPWKKDSNGIFGKVDMLNDKYIGERCFDSKQDADYVLYVANEHPKLLEQNKKLLEALEKLHSRLCADSQERHFLTKHIQGSDERIQETIKLLHDAYVTLNSIKDNTNVS